jgi:aminotransferase
LVRGIGVATVPGSSFFDRKELGRNYVRFCFCKSDREVRNEEGVVIQFDTLGEAIRRLQKLRAIV